MHVAALHDGNERGRLFRCEGLFANCFLGARFLRNIDNGKTGIVHPSISLSFQRILHVIGHAMKFLRAHDKIDMRQIFEQRLAARLRHAAKKTEDNVRPVFRHASEHPHFAERLLVGHVAHAARVQEDHVGFGFTFHALVATRNERMRDLLRVALVHLAAVGLDEEFRHGRAK